jgi:outer membrane protein assembly factor BamA
LFEAERRLERERAGEPDSPGGTVSLEPPSSAGRTLRRIDVIGLSDAQMQELSSRLPVRIGDNLSPELIEKTGKAVRDFDQHLELSISREGDQYAFLTIEMPAAGRRIVLRQK